MNYISQIPLDLHRQIRTYLDASSVYSLRRADKFSLKSEIFPLKRLRIERQFIRDLQPKIGYYFCGRLKILSWNICMSMMMLAFLLAHWKEKYFVQIYVH